MQSQVKTIAKTRFRRAKWIALFLLVLCSTACLVCLRSRPVRAYFLGQLGMIADVQDRRIFAESTTAKANVDNVRNVLDECVAIVERAHGRPFASSVRIYVCATQQSYNDRTGAPKKGRARGAVFADCVFLSPRTFETQTCRGILTHELSHLHFRQILGTAYTSEIPGWFQEGLAVFVSSGGGAEPVSEDQSRASIVAGISIHPEDVGSNYPRMASDHGLRHHMFYRQSAMFVGYLADSRPDAFKRLLTQLLDGVSFKDAFENAYDQRVSTAWGMFRKSLESAEPSVARRPRVDGLVGARGSTGRPNVLSSFLDDGLIDS